ncbi:glutamate racemase [Roseivirga sp. E12]|uniref:glutamate racemase n=1 Tax=Roseivirga sp. E12 TaxID=2819237 RepID=UPI001ABD1F82|nr:glutamate racemase [Roseivirga sp. E12]MBO3699118.1 glutamate racemase [Roseivirga sp. E12]
MSKQRPIGIFDSGMGGLTVAHAVSHLLPEEQLIYFGDSAHLPYGDKSAATIQAYSIKICDILLQKGCKVILIACNSASAAAYELIKAYVGSKALVINVIDPVVQYVVAKYGQKRIGLIGTKQTVGSGVYEYQVKVQDSSIQIGSLATPLLVPMIEEGFHKNEISEAIIEKYLKNETLIDIEALILGCTHYPLIKPQVVKYYTQKTEVIDSSEIVASSLHQILEKNNLLAEKRIEPNQFLVSDITPSFEAATELFFGVRVPLTLHKLWE